MKKLLLVPLFLMSFTTLNVQAETLEEVKNNVNLTISQENNIHNEIEKLEEEKTNLEYKISIVETQLNSKLIKKDELDKDYNNQIENVSKEDVLTKLNKSKDVFDFFNRLLNPKSDERVQELEKEKKETDEQLENYKNLNSELKKDLIVIYTLISNKKIQLNELHSVKNEQIKTLEELEKIENTMIKPAQGYISSLFGWREDPFNPSATTYHYGIDIAGSGNIVSALKGVIEKVDDTGSHGYGKYVVVDHGVVNGKHIKTLYAHLSTVNVRVGQTVTKGDILGVMGNTGSSTGTHLHFEVIVDSVKVDPLFYLKD